MSTTTAGEAARQTAAWIRSAEVRTPAGVCWPVKPDVSSACTDDLYSGGAGVVLFLLELDATAPSGDLRARVAAAACRLAPAVEAGSPGLYTGAAGIGWVLAQVHRVTGDPHALAGARSAVERLARDARPVGRGVEWNDSTDLVAGSAGIAMALLQLAEPLDLAHARDLAVRAGRRLLERAEATQHGVHWRERPSEPVLMPNLAHGTAGVALFLAMLALATGEAAFADAAVAGAETLCQLADGHDDGFLVAHHLPGGEQLHYRGWCHGPVGTARLFVALGRLTGEARWHELVLRCARSVLAAGVPGPGAPGFWDNVGQCCGSAGAAELLLAVHRLTGEADHLEGCRRIADDIICRAHRTGHGWCWPHAEHRLRPHEVAAQTGLMQGAAGIGLLLLRLDAFDHGREPFVTLPDDPWPLVLDGTGASQRPREVAAGTGATVRLTGAAARAILDPWPQATQTPRSPGPGQDQIRRATTTRRPGTALVEASPGP